MVGEVSATTVMLGLGGFVLLAVDDHDGELVAAVETTAVEVACPACVLLARLHDRRPSYVWDLNRPELLDGRLSRERLLGGIVGLTVVLGFDLDRGSVAEGGGQPGPVEPVDPRQQGR